MSSSAWSSGTSTALVWLVLATCNNIGVTLLNKVAFSTVDFHYPFFLSAVHMACSAFGSLYVLWVMERVNNTTSLSSSSSSCSLQKREGTTAAHHQQEHWVTRLLGQIQRTKLDKKGHQLIVAFSFIFSMNIAIGNVSLKHVSVNFNQVMRSLVPACTIALGWFVGKKTSLPRMLAVVPVIVGVAMACFGDMSYTAIGLFYTILCVVLAAFKVVASGELMTGELVLHPIDLLGHVAPYAFVQCLALAWWTGEVDAIAARWSSELSPAVDPYPMLVVLVTGILSFSMNICSLQANKVTSALTMCIAGNVKQVLLIVLSTIVFGVEVTPLNGAGIFVVLMGSAFYSYVSLLEKTIATNKQAVIEREESTTCSDEYTDDDVEYLLLGDEETGFADETTGTSSSELCSTGSLRRPVSPTSRQDVVLSLTTQSKT